MKPSIHPAYPESRVHCACGNSWVTRSTSGELHLDICSACHPFFTGKQKLLDTQGRIERFKKKYDGTKAAAKKAKDTAAELAKAEAKPKAVEAEKPPKAPKAEKKPKAEKAKAAVEGEPTKA